MNLVRLLNLRFLNELAATNDRNLKFAALVVSTPPSLAAEPSANELFLFAMENVPGECSRLPELIGPIIVPASTDYTRYL
jgi:hypothetical protein